LAELLEVSDERGCTYIKFFLLNEEELGGGDREMVSGLSSVNRRCLRIATKGGVAAGDLYSTRQTLSLNELDISRGPPSSRGPRGARVDGGSLAIHRDRLSLDRRLAIEGTHRTLP